MSKGIANYPAHMQAAVVARRMKTYDPKGINGIGTLAAKDYYDKHMGKKTKTAEAMAALMTPVREEDSDEEEDLSLSSE